jgi:hypothetical protein
MEETEKDADLDHDGDRKWTVGTSISSAERRMFLSTDLH